MLHDNNLIEMCLRLNRSEPLFRTILELPGIGIRPRTKDDLRLRRNLPLSFMVVRNPYKQTIGYIRTKRQTKKEKNFKQAKTNYTSFLFFFFKILFQL